MALTERPVFVPVNPQGIVDEMVAYYESAETGLGKKIEPASIERLLINGFAYRESLLRNAINDTGVMNLLRFAPAPMLDYLGELVGVSRIPAVPSGCTLLLTFAGNTTPIVVPEGTRIGAQDQKVFFRTIEAVSVPANTVNVSVKAECDTAGLVGNGYNQGEINLIMDPVAYLAEATNSDVTAGGAEEEADERLRERIKLAPSAFSTAGSINAYKFWALTANPLIVDVSVPRVPVVPGEVRIYPLMESGDVTPSEVIDQVKAAVEPDNVRPLTDTPVVTSPTRIDYTLQVNVTLFEDSIQQDVTDKANENLQTFVDEKRRKLGRDIIGTQIIAALSKDLEADLYKVELVGFSDIVVNENSFAFCTAFNISVVGINPG
jgi:phage-related baseplate assembly protein